MLSKKVEEALNAQINAEFWSAYIYLSMSADFSEKGLNGFANWMFVQFREEQDHAMKFFNYVIARGGRVELEPVPGVKTSWESAMEIFNESLGHERKVTAMINDIYKTAVEVNDYATQSFLKWYIDEQVEEEENATLIIDKLKLIGGDGAGLYLLDQEMAARVYKPINTVQ